MLNQHSQNLAILNIYSKASFEQQTLQQCPNHFMKTNLIIKQDMVLLSINIHRSKFYNQKKVTCYLFAQMYELYAITLAHKELFSMAHVWDKTPKCYMPTYCTLA